jgi:hypothetical protein
MQKNVLQRLRDVLALEEKHEWLADAIAGGFRAFQEIWEADAIKSGLDAAWVRQISERILRYALRARSWGCWIDPRSQIRRCAMWIK